MRNVNGKCHTKKPNITEKPFIHQWVTMEALCFLLIFLNRYYFISWLLRFALWWAGLGTPVNSQVTSAPDTVPCTGFTEGMQRMHSKWNTSEVLINASYTAIVQSPALRGTVLKSVSPLSWHKGRGQSLNGSSITQSHTRKMMVSFILHNKNPTLKIKNSRLLSCAKFENHITSNSINIHWLPTKYWAWGGKRAWNSCLPERRAYVCTGPSITGPLWS